MGDQAGQKKSDSMQANGDILKINTLGRFAVSRGSTILTAENQRSGKRWRLFQLLVTYREQGLSLEKLFGHLKLNESVNPPEALKSLVYYLRRALRGDQEASERYIICSRGLYYFNQDAEYWLDCEVFENLYRKAEEKKERSKDEALTFYRQAITLYKDDYLIESGTEAWILPARNHYRNLYLKALVSTCDLLMQDGEYELAGELCETGLRINPLEEKLHQIILQILIDTDQITRARTHFEETAALFIQNNLLLPPAIRKMEGVFKNIAVSNDDKEPLDIFQTLRKRRQQNGAFTCDMQTLMAIYELEKAKSERSGKQTSLVNLRLNGESPGKNGNPSDVLLIYELLKKELRRGDVVCNWDYNDFAILLTDTSYEQATKVMERITRSFDHKNSDKEAELQVLFLETS